MNLIEVAEAGDAAGVLRELGALTSAQRAGHAEALAARSEAMATAPDGHTDEQRDAQRLAELGCQVSPEAAASWLLRNQPEYPAFIPYPGYDRLAEVASLYPPDWRESGPQPYLLAVPTLATGALDAGVLVERISGLEKLSVTPAPVDLAQALLRVAPTDDPRVLRAAGELRSGAGQRLARWLRDGGLPRQDSEPKDWYRPESGGSLEPARPGTTLDPWFPPVAAALTGPFHRDRKLMEPPLPYWVAQLPHHRDEMMAREYTSGCCYSGQQRTRVLPFVAEASGPAGYAVHIGLAKGLANRPHGDDATVDALLVLAARGQLDTGLLGRQLEMLLRAQLIEVNRVADSLRAAAETGAYGAVWAVIEAALPGLLRDTPIKGAAVLLSLAVECVSRCGAKGEIAEVTAEAERGGSSQAAKTARLLRDALR